MNRYDAKYTIQEIKNLQYYQHKLTELKDQIDEVQRQIDSATSPHSPQGTENIGAGKTLSFSGRETYLNWKITKKDELIKLYNKFADRHSEAQLNLYKVLDETQEKDFVRDYFSGKYSKQEIEIKYAVSKAYRKILSIVMDSLK